MDKPILRLDFETFSEVDLTKVGSSVYSRHPSTEVLMLAYAVDDGPVEQWVPAIGEPMPKVLKKELLPDPQIIKSAWNSTFERQIFANTLRMEIPFEQWRDPMVLAHSLALPGTLAKCGEVVNLPEDQKKIARGKALIRLFCGPRKPTKAKPWTRATWRNEPDAWEEFLEYNRQDVTAERAIHRRLRKFDMPEHEWELWHLDQRINEAGLPINMAAVENAIRISHAVVEDRMARMRELTGLDNPNSTTQLLPWLQAFGDLYPFEDLQKVHVQKALERAVQRHEEGGFVDFDPSPAIEVLRLRQEVSRASVKKYEALARATDEDGNLRNTLQFAGAGRTWRWAGRRYQAQNLSRPTKDLKNCMERAVEHVEKLPPEAIDMLYDSPMDLLASCVRPVFQAPKGQMLADADLNAIENRVLGWVAGCDKILQVFREGRCPYLDFGTYMYGEDYETLWLEYKAGNSEKRTGAKPGVLGCFGPDTEVLTDSGWKRIIEVTTADKVFDGVEFVAHEGVIDQGVKQVINLGGVLVTPDHEILTGEGWAQAWRLEEDENLMSSALSLVNGLSTGQNTEADRGGTTGANVPAEENRGFGVRTSDAGSAQGAGYAPGETEPTQRGRNSEGTSTRSTRTGSTQSGAGAETRRTINTGTTAVEGLSANSTALKSSSGMSCLCPDSVTRASKWIEKTIMGTMSPGTSGSSTGLGRTGTDGTHGASNGSEKCIASRNFTGGSAQRIETCPQSEESCAKGSHRAKSSKSRRIAGARTVYDILEAGPRNRFVIRTDEGPLIAHNCGYMLSAGKVRVNPRTGEEEATGLLGYAQSLGIALTPEQSEKSVTVFRNTYEEVVDFWWDIDKIVRRTIISRKPHKLRMLTFDIKGPFLRIGLPSGRFLHYCRPKVEPKMMPWGKVKDAITYEGLNDQKQWVRIQTHPGKLTENVVQAIARDLLAHGMTLADDSGLDVRLHIHDQIVTLCDEATAEDDLKTLQDCMSVTPDWAPGLPLAADGFLSRVFKKD